MDPELGDGLSTAQSGEELRERLPEASRCAELRERLPTDEGDLDILDASIQDRVRSCSRKNKVPVKDGPFV